MAVEVDVSEGLPGINTVGLPDAAVKESRERVTAALTNTGYVIPEERITVNLAPAGVKKEGAAFDLPIALGILGATCQLDGTILDQVMVVGELSLDGGLRPIRGALPMAVAATREGVGRLLLPADNAREAAVVEGVEVYAIRHLREAIAFLAGRSAFSPVRVDLAEVFSGQREDTVDLSDVKGQEHVKRALEVSAAGGHNLLMIGPPGAGKTMLARRLPTILPAMSLEEALETTAIHSVAGRLLRGQALLASRPFRAPHHTISDAGLVGGGAHPRPGEVSLAHHGVLFLDELPEFRKNVLEVLRQPLEDGFVTIARAAVSLTFPARFMLSAAMNPCPCGYLGDLVHPCTCLPPQIQRYRTKLSGPLLDRIDLHVEVPALRYQELTDDRTGEPSEAVRARVEAARSRQRSRFEGRRGVFTNADMGPRQLRRWCRLDQEGEYLLRAAIERLGLSARAYHRVLKVARTIADLEGVEGVRAAHVAEAIQYRSLDRIQWESAVS